MKVSRKTRFKQLSVFSRGLFPSISRSIGWLFSVLFMAQNVEGLIGNPAKIGRKGSRKPRWEEVMVRRRRMMSAILKVVFYL